MAGAPVAAHASRKKAAFFRAFDEWTSAPGVSASAQAMTRPGKPAAGAEVDPDRGLGRQSQKLQRIGDMPGPDHRYGRGRDQIHPLLPVQQQRRRSDRDGPMFHVKQASARGPASRSADRSADRPRSAAPPSASRRAATALAAPTMKCATSSVSAAGVMPSIRPAWPMVRGRCVAACGGPRWRGRAGSRNRCRPAGRELSSRR